MKYTTWKFDNNGKMLTMTTYNDNVVVVDNNDDDVYDEIEWDGRYKDAYTMCTYIQINLNSRNKPDINWNTHRHSPYDVNVYVTLEQPQLDN